MPGQTPPHTLKRNQKIDQRLPISTYTHKEGDIIPKSRHTPDNCDGHTVMTVPITWKCTHKKSRVFKPCNTLSQSYFQVSELFFGFFPRVWVGICPAHELSGIFMCILSQVYNLFVDIWNWMLFYNHVRVAGWKISPEPDCISHNHNACPKTHQRTSILGSIPSHRSENSHPQADQRS
jgi:hypothetical protein